MKSCFLLLAFHLICLPAYTQKTHSDFGFVHQRVVSKNDTIHYYIYADKEGLKKKKPLFLYLEGSGPLPLFYSVAGEEYSSILLPYKKLAANYHFVVISKPGISFYTAAREKVPQKYYDKLSQDYRVWMADQVINHTIQSGLIDKQKVVVVGHSEGGQIAPRLAFTNKKITHLACLSGDGLNQVYDFVQDVRKQYSRREITKEEATLEIDSIFYYYEDILKQPLATNKFWRGHTYLRWSTSLRENPLDYMLKLYIPLYVVAGTADESAPIENMDYIKVALMQAGKKNLTYRYYWNYDHVYNEVIMKEGSPQLIPRDEEVIRDLVEWLK